ncbi:hypothetical protein CYL21_2497 [Plasmodium falciparum NF54]|uniref:Protein SOC3, putative n=3 Tax=Plasmodium falciparum TaxID=5833 RepID=A0A144A207_PLAF7|nr:protein SOC3, putative [Plasmodium falciparum 3D7]KAF4329322.1 hypothetical protein CYL21_2497 [Plasmodium falciparum NF54]PKC49706.1 hypothetical protein CK202_0431 [Plasmodium falciparum NF54]CZU00102.1 protein SOC3, putative [Plasmodium falciparum 3D7]|eukprot:XP_024329208.1 conserved Plasmodium protein, unknown function [Plasmodium falciparum 3D7]
MKNQNTDKLTNLKDLVPFYKKDNEKLNENTEDIVYSVKKKFNCIKEIGESTFNKYEHTRKNLELLNRELKLNKISLGHQKNEYEEIKIKNEEILNKFENLKHSKCTYQIMLQRIKKEKKLLYFYLNSLERTVASLKNNEKQLHNNIQKITSDNKNLKKSIEEKKMDIIKAKNKNEEILKYMNVNKEHSNILRIRREMINEYKTNKLNDSNIALMIEEKKKYKKLLIYYLLYNNYLKLSASNIFENASSIYATISKLREATGVTDIYDINQKFMDIENKKNLLQKEEELSQKRLEDAIQEYQALNNEILNTFSEDKNILKKKIQNEKEKISDDIYESYKLVFASERELEDINIKLDKIKKFLEKQNSYFHSINMEEKMEFHSNEDMLQYIKNLKGVVETLMKITQQNRENGNISRSYKSLEFLEIMNLYRNVDFHKNMCRVDDTQELENTIKMESKTLNKGKLP